MTGWSLHPIGGMPTGVSLCKIQEWYFEKLCPTASYSELFWSHSTAIKKSTCASGWQKWMICWKLQAVEDVPTGTVGTAWMNQIYWCTPNLVISDSILYCYKITKVSMQSPASWSWGGCVTLAPLMETHVGVISLFFSPCHLLHDDFSRLHPKVHPLVHVLLELCCHRAIGVATSVW